jgi:hypothetical protein
MVNAEDRNSNTDISEIGIQPHRLRISLKGEYLIPTMLYQSTHINTSVIQV